MPSKILDSQHLRAGHTLWTVAETKDDGGIDKIRLFLAADAVNDPFQRHHQAQLMASLEAKSIATHPIAMDTIEAFQDVPGRESILQHSQENAVELLLHPAKTQEENIANIRTKLKRFEVEHIVTQNEPPALIALAQIGEQSTIDRVVKAVEKAYAAQAPAAEVSAEAAIPNATQQGRAVS